ncbi:MAG: hypothetical protein AB1611_04970 [bacterium]
MAGEGGHYLTGRVIPALCTKSDSALGFWIGGGIYWTISKIFNLGLQIRYSKAEVTIFEEDVEAGGLHYGFLSGVHF